MPRLSATTIDYRLLYILLYSIICQCVYCRRARFNRSKLCLLTDTIEFSWSDYPLQLCSSNFICFIFLERAFLGKIPSEISLQITWECCGTPKTREKTFLRRPVRLSKKSGTASLVSNNGLRILSVIWRKLSVIQRSRLGR